MKKPYTSIAEAIRDLFGEGRTIADRRPASGGDINEAHILTLDDGASLFMKTNTVRFLPAFEAEVEGLTEIRRTGAIGVPKVLGFGTDKGYSFLLLEYIGGAGRIKEYWETFALELIAMHRSDVGSRYGFRQDNWIGAGRQRNAWHDSWISFFRDCRLVPQFELAAKYFSQSDHRRIDRLLSNLDRYLTEPEKPSLLHGDLWGGNHMTGNDGKAWLIDPAVYYGHPEADIAMTELFGGFRSEFYRTLREAGHLDKDYPDRRDLYNLYHLLNHLNLFGSGYLGSVLRIVDRYAG